MHGDAPIITGLARAGSSITTLRGGFLGFCKLVRPILVHLLEAALGDACALQCQVSPYHIFVEYIELVHVEFIATCSAHLLFAPQC